MKWFEKANVNKLVLFVSLLFACMMFEYVIVDLGM